MNNALTSPYREIKIIEYDQAREVNVPREINNFRVSPGSSKIRAINQTDVFDKSLDEV